MHCETPGRPRPSWQIRIAYDGSLPFEEDPQMRQSPRSHE